MKKLTKKLKFAIAPMHNGNIWGPLALFCRDAKDAGWNRDEILNVADTVIKVHTDLGYETAFKKLASYCK